MQAPRTMQRLFAHSVRRYHVEGFQPPSMNELPVPKGSWQANYDSKQGKYNAVLALGVGFTVFSLAVAKQSGLVYLNFSPPKTID